MARPDERGRDPSGRRAVAPRILLAEDDREFRTLLASALRRGGYQVLEAETGTELAEKLGSTYFRDRKPVDLIISDIRMPGFPALDVLEGFRLSCRTPFIVMTAFGSHTMRAEARRLGASYFFDKPFMIEELVEAVSNLVPHQAEAPSLPGDSRGTVA